MKLKKVGSNMTEISAGDMTVLFSYDTPVACNIAGDGWYRTEKKWSKTTSRHINKWLNGITAAEKPQEFFDKLMAG